MTALPRFRAQWSDGVERVIHAVCFQAARECAERLAVPAGAYLTLLEPILERDADASYPSLDSGLSRKLVGERP